MDGAALAARIRTEVAGEAAALGSLGLATVLVGDDPASRDLHPPQARGRARGRHHGARPPSAGRRRRRTSCSRSSRELNANDDVDGILVQLPLPDHIDEARVLRAVAPVKDVDGFHPVSAGQLYLDEPTFVPATPLGVMALLEEYERRARRARARS